MEPSDYRLAAVMFTDIVGFSRMMEEDEKGTLTTLDFHNDLVREQVARFRGGVIKTIGDAFLVQFSTTLDAVQCAIAVQDGIREYNDAKLGKPLTLRIGVHLGDIYFYENDALGEGINIASRLQSMTKPGHITISREVYSQVSGKLPMRVEALGQVQLKNITREVHAYEILPGGQDNNSSAFRQAHAEPKVPAPQVAQPQVALSPDEPPQGGDASRPAGPPPSFRDLRDDWRTLRRRIKHQMRDQFRDHAAGGLGRDGWHDLVQNQLRQELHKAFGEAGLGSLGDPPKASFSEYKQKKLRKAERAKAGFTGHLIPFVVVNAVLASISLTVSPTFPWFLIPLFGWGVGLISHWSAVRGAKKTARELEPIEDMSDEDLAVFKGYQDARGSFFAQVGSNLGISALLLVIWLLTGGTFPWPLIPIAALALGIFSRIGPLGTRRAEFRALRKRLGSGGRSSTKDKSGVSERGGDPLVAKAQNLRDSIVAQARGLKGGSPFGDDMNVTLDHYVRQITELSTIERELNQVVTSFHPADLDAEEATLRTKVANTTSTVLKQEYEKSLSELDHQRKSFVELAEQQEILSLRIKSALGNLQQMQVDLARIKGLSDTQNKGSFISIQEKSEELSRYLEDYREGLKEIPD